MNAFVYVLNVSVNFLYVLKSHLSIDRHGFMETILRTRHVILPLIYVFIVPNTSCKFLLGVQLNNYYILH